MRGGDTGDAEEAARLVKRYGARLVHVTDREVTLAETTIEQAMEEYAELVDEVRRGGVGGVTGERDLRDMSRRMDERGKVWTLSIPKFTSYTRDSNRAIFTARAHILPAVEEDGLFVHPVWIGEREPPLTPPRKAMAGHTYLAKYISAAEGDGTWIAVYSQDLLNGGDMRVVERRERYELVSFDVVVVDVLLVREDHFTRYNFTKELRAAYLLSHSIPHYRATRRLWTDTQSSSSVSIPSSMQGTHTLSAVVRYFDGSHSSGRKTSISVTVPSKP